MRNLGRMNDAPRSKAAEPAIGREMAGRGPVYFDNVVFDNLLDALTELAAEVWTLRDRQYVLERVLTARGEDVGAAIEAYRFSEGEAAERKALRDRFVGQVFASFLRRPE